MWSLVFGISHSLVNQEVCKERSQFFSIPAYLNKKLVSVYNKILGSAVLCAVLCYLLVLNVWFAVVGWIRQAQWRPDLGFIKRITWPPEELMNSHELFQGVISSAIVRKFWLTGFRYKQMKNCSVLQLLTILTMVYWNGRDWSIAHCSSPVIAKIRLRLSEAGSASFFRWKCQRFEPALLSPESPNCNSVFFPAMRFLYGLHGSLMRPFPFNIGNKVRTYFFLSNRTIPGIFHGSRCAKPLLPPTSNLFTPLFLFYFFFLFH